MVIKGKTRGTRFGASLQRLTVRAMHCASCAPSRRVFEDESSSFCDLLILPLVNFAYLG